MYKIKANYQYLSIIFIFLFIVSPFVNAYSVNSADQLEFDEIYLPTPIDINVSIEYLLHHRTCIRSFNETPVSNEQLSTILWAATGLIDDNNQTINSINGSLAVKLYVIKKEGVFYYNQINHSLIFHKEGDYRGIAQYWAPVLIGIVWDRSKNQNEYIAGAQIGESAQNIILTATALGLGTVPTNDFISPLLNIDLPLNEDPKLVMPLGQPKNPTIWKYRPKYLSFLPKIKDSNSNLSQLLIEMRTTSKFDDKKLSRQNISQLLWACYGYSYYIDVSRQNSITGQRHRTVPSGHGYYPLDIYAVSSKGVYRYIPGIKYIDSYGYPIITFLQKRSTGDYRQTIADCSEEFVKDAPFSIIIVLNVKHTEKRGLRGDDFSALKYRWLWYYEAGSCAHNSLLEAEAWGMKGNIVEIQNQEKVSDILKLNEKCIPLFVVPLGFSSKF